MISTRHAAAGFALALFSAAPLAAQSTTRVSVPASGGQANSNCFRPTISADGRYVVFDSNASNLVAGDTNGQTDVFLRDRVAGTTVCVSVTSSGTPGNSWSYNPLLSADGRFVAFQSGASDLVAGDTNATDDVFLRDLSTGTTERLSVSNGGGEADDYSTPTWITADGRFVGFYSKATNLVGGDTNGRADIFVRDHATGTTVRVSTSTSGAQTTDDCQGGCVSDDGHYAVFTSASSNLVAGDTNGAYDIFLRDLWAATTTRVSVTATNAQANSNSGLGILSPSGRWLAFSSMATNLVAGDTNATSDVFVRDLLLGTLERVSLDSFGNEGNDGSSPSQISDDGRFVLMFSSATNLVPGDTNAGLDCFLRDRVTCETSRVSLGTGGVQGNSYSYGGHMTPDARLVVFQSGASNLVAGDTNGMNDIFLRDRGIAPVSSFCLGDGTQATACPCGNDGAPGRGCENSSNRRGALLEVSAFGAEPDSATLVASGVVPNALTIFLQGNAQLPGLPFGDGVRCVGGALKRLYATSANGSGANAPSAGSLPLGLQSALLGDPIASGTSRWYQAWYRDADASFCAAPQGGLSNVTNGVRVDW